MTGRKLVILAEDDSSESRLYVKLIQELGFEVRAYENGALALTALRALSDEEKAKAILITDNSMPERNGVDLAKAVNDEFPTIPILFWSTVVGSILRETAGRHAHHVTSKPHKKADIETAISEMFAKYTAQQKLSDDVGKGPLDHAQKGTDELPKH